MPLDVSPNICQLDYICCDNLSKELGSNLGNQTRVWGQRIREWCNDCDDDGSIDPSKGCNLDIEGRLHLTIIAVRFKIRDELSKLWVTKIET